MKLSTSKPLYTIFSVIVFFTLSTIWVNAINTLETGYQVAIGGYYSGMNITAHSECMRIQNNGIRDIFVPTKTAAEWQAFRDSVGGSDTDGIQNALGGTCCDVQSYYTCELGDIYWYNSCDVREGVKESCSENCTGNTCCTPEANSTCYSGDVYWYNLCGIRGSKKTECGTANCSGDVCCTSNVSSTCSGSDVYWYSSCGSRQSMKTDCGTCGCPDSTCVAPGNNIYTTCSGADLVKRDSCGNLVEKIKTCDDGCSGNACIWIDPCVYPVTASQCSSCGGSWNQYPPPSTGGMCITVH